VQPGGTGVPDVLAQPSGWSQGISLPGSGDLSDSNVMETGVGNIVIISVLGDTYAVDLDANSMLWSLPGYTYWVTLPDGTGVVTEDASGQVGKVDVQTGQVNVIGALPTDSDIEYVSSTLVVTDSMNEGQYCARLLTALDTCQWQASDDIVWGTRVFGDGHWFSTADGVFDLTTGQLAPFGKDSYVDDSGIGTVYYDGPDGGVTRLSTDAKSGATALQPWDTANDLALAPPTAVSGWVDPDTLDAPLIYAHGQTDSGGYLLTAYSWQTGQQVWWAAPKLVEGDPGLWSFGDYVQVWIDAQDSPAHPNRPPSAIINSTNGQVLWLGSDRMVAMAGQQVVYVGSAEPYDNGGTLDAYDGQSGDFSHLWSINAPEAQVQFVGVAGRIIALSCTSGQIWVLNTK